MKAAGASSGDLLSLRVGAGPHGRCRYEVGAKNTPVPPAESAGGTPAPIRGRRLRPEEPLPRWRLHASDCTAHMRGLASKREQ